MAALYAAEGVLAWYTARVAKQADTWAGRPRLKRLALAAVLRHPHELPAPLLSEQIRGSGKPGFMPALDALTSYPIRDRLSDIAVPTLIVWGTHDRLVPLKDASEFERLIPGSRKVIFNDTGHMPMLERPGRFNRLLEDFLAERPSAAEGPVDEAEAEAVREAEAEAAPTGD
jgi:pimeloyl-ACP methyl ester carboxylesterase